MSDGFYKALEDAHRGSFEVITQRLRVYNAFLEALADAYPRGSALDLGCGRGEWLGLASEAGLDARGVDLDEHMVAQAREHGLAAEVGDAIEGLRALPDESMALVSSFHLIEHIPFDDVKVLVREALRVLKPGGLLVLETPNPENTVVGTSDFHLDPTHVRPIPPGLLAFLPQHYGFARTKLLRLQEAPWLEQATPALISVLRDVSADAAVVAQKAGPPELLARFDAAFGADRGLTTEAMATRYDDYVDARFTAAHERVAALEARVAAAESAAAAAAGSAARTIAQAQGEATRANEELRQMLASRSWRLTAPLRALADTISRILGRQP